MISIQAHNYEFVANNTLRQGVEEHWLHTTTNDALQAKADLLIPKIFDAEKAKAIKALETY